MKAPAGAGAGHTVSSFHLDSPGLELDHHTGYVASPCACDCRDG